MITIAETAPFQRKIAGLLSDEERADLIAYLAEHPSAGVLIQGTGGIRKLRWARRGGGKSACFPGCRGTCLWLVWRQIRLVGL